jgi:Mrp family chromosome partitioning ATPase
MSERMGVGWPEASYWADDEPIDSARHLAAVKRAWPLIALFVVSLSVIVLALSLVLPETYRASARIVMDDRAGAFDPVDAETVKRRLATAQALVTTRRVLAIAGERLAGESAETLDDKVTAAVGPEANVIDVVARDGDPRGAATIANVVARSFLEERRAAEEQRIERTRSNLRRALDRVRGSPARQAEASAIVERLSELNVTESGVGSELQLVQAAEPPSAADSPRPAQNTVFAAFAAALLGVLTALALDRVAPRLTGPRELERLSGAPILATLPRKRWRRDGPTEDAADVYQALDAYVSQALDGLSLSLPPERRVLVVADAAGDDGAASVAATLARTHSRSGSATLVVSANLRRPRLHDVLGMSRAPGLADVVSELEQDRATTERVVQRLVASVHADPGELALDILPAGRPVASPASVLANPLLTQLFEELRRSMYELVVVEGPPLLGVGDGQLIARVADALLVVCRLDRTTPATAAELGDLLHQLHGPLLGVVATGAPEATYSLGAPSRALDEAHVALRA